MSENTPQTMTPPPRPPAKADSSQGFANIFFSVIIPVLILNKGTKYGLTPVLALVVALAFPLIFGLYSLIKEKKMNYIALLGLLNVLSSGVLTVLALGGIWFAIKEAVFPLLIGIFVYVSSFSDKPFFQSMFLNPTAFDVAKLWESLNTSEKKSQFLQTMKKATQGLSLSFLLSAILNFCLAFVIFKPLPEELTELEKQDLLNVQLSQMTMYSFVVIMIPILIVVSLVLYLTFKKTTQITGLTLEDLMVK
jgi:intracellular septation protein A